MTAQQSRQADNHPTQGGQSQFVRVRDGLRLHIRKYASNSNDRVEAVPALCLAGLSRNSRDFDRLATALSTDQKAPRDVYCIDFRGRGLSDYDPQWSNYNILKEAEDVVDVLTALGIEHAHFIGTSRGGLVTMIMAALRPGAIKSAVFNDIGPVIEGDGLTQIRLYLQRSPSPASWREAEDIQRGVMAKAFSAMDEADWVREAWVRYREINGRIVPDHDPNLVKTLTNIDLETRLPTMWPQFLGLRSRPLLVLRGENSTLLREKTMEQMAQQHTSMQSIIIRNQGHAPLLTKDDTIEPIARFITKH